MLVMRDCGKKGEGAWRQKCDLYKQGKSIIVLHTGHVQRRKKKPLNSELMQQIPQPWRGGRTPRGKARSNEGWMSACPAHAYLWRSTSSGDTSQAVRWRTGELWRKIMSWEVHDTLLRSLWLDLGNQMDLQGKGTISEPLHLGYFWAPEQLFMRRKSCFCLKSKFWLMCSEEAAFHSRPEVPGISMMSPFSTDLPLTAQRHAISFVLFELNSPTCSLAIPAKTKSAGNFTLDAQGAPGSGRWEDLFWMLALC